MPVLPVQIIAPTFADGYCPPTAQQFANDLLSGAQLSSSLTLDKVLVQDSAPSDHTKLWFKTVGGTYPFPYPNIPLYYWHTGLAMWVARHPADEFTHRWEEFANAADIDTYEGGEVGAINPNGTTGPFWAIDPAYNGRSPMSPGAISGSSPAKTLGYREDYGSGSHTQGAEEVGPHVHPLNADPSIESGDNIKVVSSGSGGTGLLIGGSGAASTDLSVLTNKYSATQQAMPVVHPVRGMSCVVRTARIWYRG